MSQATFANKESKIMASKTKATAKNASGGLRIGEANDAFEREADRVADEVMAGGNPRRDWSFSRMSVGTPLQRKCACGGSEPTDRQVSAGIAKRRRLCNEKRQAQVES